MSWPEIFSVRLPHIYLVYGLAFFVLGLAVALEIGRTGSTRFTWAMKPLAFFGLVHGSHEWIEMMCDDSSVVLQIEDDGLGFDTGTLSDAGDRQSGWGIMGIQERVKLADGKVQMQSEPGKGTRLVVEVPLKNSGGSENATHQTDAGR
jgi:hypothetical protein